MNRTKFFGAAFVLLTSANAQSVAPSSIPVHNLKLERGPANWVLAKLAEKYHIVIGVSGKVIRDRGHERLVNISLKDGTLGQVFDAVVWNDPSYKWKTTSSGSVHFVFADYRLTVLDVRVRAFDGKKPSRFDPFVLYQIPEVSAWGRKNNCFLNHMEIVVGSSPPEWPPFEVHVKDVPFRAVLDEVARKSGEYFWSLFQLSDKPCDIDIQF
jgi:hypothetical protein